MIEIIFIVIAISVFIFLIMFLISTSTEVIETKEISKQKVAKPRFIRVYLNIRKFDGEFINYEQVELEQKLLKFKHREGDKKIYNIYHLNNLR